MVGWCHAPAPRSIIIVRDALVTSVTCFVPAPPAPPVRFHASHESTVPKSAVPPSTAAFTAGRLSIIHRSFTPEKYVEIGSPQTERSASFPPSAASSAAAVSLVRASCHSTQSYSGSPVRLSHTTVDSLGW